MSKDDFEDSGTQHLNDATCNTESASTSSNNGNQDCQQNCDATVGTKRVKKNSSTRKTTTSKYKHRVTNEPDVTRRKRRFSETEVKNYNDTMEDSESNGKKKLRPNLQTRGNRTFEDQLKNGMASTQGSRRKRRSLSPENEHVHGNNKRSRKEKTETQINLELGLSALHKNFKIIHRELCIEDLMTENSQISSLLFIEKRRRLKIDKLLSELETDRELIGIFFQNLGKSETNRPLADKLKQPCSSPSSETFDSSENLVERFSQQTWYIKQSLEPIDIIATAVEFEGVQFKDNYNISKAETRQERVNILFEAINRLETRDKWRILKPLYDHLLEETDNETTSTPVVTVRVPQETQRHETFLNEDIWNNLANLSLEEIDAETRRLRKLFEGFSKTSLNIHFVECGPNDVKTIRKFCEDGQLESLLVAMIDKGAINKLIHLGQIVAHVSLYNGFKIQACLCYLNKETFKENMSYITEKCSGFEIPFIDTLIGSKSLTSKMTNAIVYIKRSSKTTDIPSEIIEFLKQDDVPQICFCFLQKVLTDMKGQDIVQQLFKGEIHEGFVVELKRDITTDVVKRNAKYLEEEIEAKCFVTALSTHVGKRAKLLIKEIMSLESRQNRNTALIEFLSTEQDMSWFQEELQRYYSYLADILTTQINTNKEVVTEFRRVLFGLNDVIQDDLDPLLLAKYLTQSLLDRISFDVLQREQNRRKRSSMFMTTILRDENSTIIPEVIEAMRHDYNGLVNVVRDVVQNGSLSTYYKCPRINAQQSILRTTINLTDGICKRAEAETWQFRMIKQYSFMKNEISKVEAIEIAEYLYSKNLATEGDVQDIKESSRRRKADEKLLKLVLNGTYEMYLEFKTALNMFNLSRASEKLQSETIQDVSEGMNAGKEKLKFKNLEYDILMGELNERNLIDKINDKLLSNQIFSSQMHTDVVRCSFKRSQRLQKLIKFLETCSKCVLPTFLEILEELEKNNVTEKLQRMQHCTGNNPHTLS
ncbi:uncharacterized protein LOC132738998 [Ruditapes philippinarum]|uniref:uncharacterized protein LOC132738998 n=1 Tax=Ruditapes philippinarum TaxID=129788 RepID=UPI00295A8321|nr:uncharacterized protein LOC132738998 [Ruditapes philippinarum]